MADLPADVQAELDQPLFDPKLDPTRYLQLPVRLSPTRAELSGRCFRRHLLADILRRFKYKSASALFGTYTHAGTAAWWRYSVLEAVSLPQAYDNMMAAALEPEGGWKIDDDDKKHGKDTLRAMLDKYAVSAKLAGELPGRWEIVQLEERGWLDVAAGRQMPYQMDRLIQSLDDPDVRAVVDTKTSARPDQRWRDSMSRSIQQRLYRHANEHHLGRPVAHTIIEGLPKNGKDLSPVYHWASLGWTPAYVQEAVDFWHFCAENLEDFILEVREIAGESVDDSDLLYMTALSGAVLHPSFNTQDCLAYNFPCPYMTMCDTDPGDRLGLALSDYTLGEPWDQEVE